MVPTSLVVLLAGLGTPGLPADVEQRLRSRAVLPDGYCQFGVALNSDGSFTLGGETPGGPYTHRPLALRPSRSADTLPAVTALGKLACWEVLHPWGTDTILRQAAASICRARLARHPDDAAAMVWLGQFLDWTGRPDEAERWLRHATRTTPRDWMTWHALADHYRYRIGRAVAADSPDVPPVLTADQLNDAHWQGRFIRALSGERSDVERWFQEGADCHDWAVLFAPDAVESHVGRLGWNLTTGGMRLVAQWDPARQQAAYADLAAQMLVDAERVAELSGHPLAYGLALMSDFNRMAAGQRQEPPPSAASPFWNRGLVRLEALRSDPDPVTRADACRVLVMVRCMVFGDVAAGERLLREPWADAADPTVLNLAHLVYGGMDTRDGMIELVERRLKVKDDPYDHFLRAKGLWHSGRVAAARDATEEGLRTHPSDPRLVLMRTGLLLRHGKAADLPEAHLRLAGLEAAFAKRLTAGEELSDKDLDQLQLVRLHRAVYLGLVRRPYDATVVAGRAAAVTKSHADEAMKLAGDLIPAPVIPAAGER